MAHSHLLRSPLGHGQNRERVLDRLYWQACPECRRRRLEETAYLGYQVGRGNVRPQESKVAAIRNWPRPTIKKPVKSFLGLVGYYQRFIPGFATLASPLNDLTRKALPDRITWSVVAEKAFDDLRRALMLGARPSNP